MFEKAYFSIPISLFSVYSFERNICTFVPKPLGV